MAINKTENKYKYYVEYNRPSFYKRVFSLLLDGIIFVFIAFSLLYATDSIMKTTDYYNSVSRKYDQIKEDSGLYMLHEDSLVLITSFYQIEENIVDLTPYDIKHNYMTALDYYFDVFLETKADFKIEDYATFQKFYDAKRLEFRHNSIAYFVLKDGNIIENPDANLKNSDYIDDFYKDFIGKTAVPCLTYIEEYASSFVFLSRTIIFIEIPIPIVLASILTFYVPGLIFIRGRKSLAKLLFKIGLVDKNKYNVSWKTFTLRFLVIFFGEILLSIFTFGIPLIVSFSMMVFTKKKQSFHDFVFNIEVIDVTNSTIYKNPDEILFEKDMHQHIDFETRDFK